MLKKEIKYKDFNGDDQTDVYYFNFTEAELLDYELEYEGGLLMQLNKMVETKDNRGLLNELKKLIFSSIGVRSDDGRRFMKSEEMVEEFKDSAAYNQLVLELFLDGDGSAITAFIEGIIPTELQERAKASGMLDENGNINATAVTKLPPPPAA